MKTKIFFFIFLISINLIFCSEKSDITIRIVNGKTVFDSSVPESIENYVILETESSSLKIIIPIEYNKGVDAIIKNNFSQAKEHFKQVKECFELLKKNVHTI